jgi:hypothetical protein
MKLSIQKFNTPFLGTFRSFAIALILLLQISLPGVALCIGFDGHTALESYSEGLCNEVNSKFASQNNSDLFLGTLNSSNNQHCGSCIDIPISDINSENKLISSNDLTLKINIHQLAVYQFTSRMFLETSSINLVVQELLPNRSLLDSLQTTVITC